MAKLVFLAQERKKRRKLKVGWRVLGLVVLSIAVLENLILLYLIYGVK